MKKIKFAKVAPEICDHTGVNSIQSNYCPVELFLAKRGYEQTKLTFLTTVPTEPQIKTLNYVSPHMTSTPSPHSSSSESDTDSPSERQESLLDKRSGDKTNLCAGDHNVSCTSEDEKLTEFAETMKIEDFRKSTVYKNLKYRFGNGHRIQPL